MGPIEIKDDLRSHRTLTLDICGEPLVDAIFLYGKEAAIKMISEHLVNLFITNNVGIDWCMAPDQLEELLQPIKRIPAIQNKLQEIHDSEQAVNKIIRNLQL